MALSSPWSNRDQFLYSPRVLSLIARPPTWLPRVSGFSDGLYSLMLSGGRAAGLVLAGIADDLDCVQAVFYSAAIIFSGLGLTSGYLYRNRQFQIAGSPAGPSRHR